VRLTNKFSGSIAAVRMAGRGAYLLITAVPDGVLLSSDSNAYPLISVSTDRPSATSRRVRSWLAGGEEWIRTFGSAIFIMLRKTGFLRRISA